MYYFSAIYTNQHFHRIVSSKLDLFQVLNRFCFLKLKSFVSTSTSIQCNHIVNLREPLSSHTNEIRSKLKKDVINSFSEMSFHISTGGRVSATDNGVIPGTSVCFQFWITYDLLRLVAVCTLREPTRLDKTSKNVLTLRKYELVNEDSDHDSNNPDIGVTLRVMNYNVLSQNLLEEHHYLYRKQSPKVLSWGYRSHLILAEILAVKPDVLCLQEVEEFHIPTFYKNLENYGYQGVTKIKTGFKRNGLAIFYRVPDIKLLETENVEYKQPGVIQLATRDNVGLIAKLEKEGKQFIVANTHLLYNPRRTEVRLAQLQIFLAEIDRISRKTPEHIGILLMGDLNSTPDSSVIILLNEGKLFSGYRPLPPCLGISTKCVHMQQESKLYHSQKQFGLPCEGKEELDPVSLPSAAVNQSYLLSHNFKFSSAYNLTESEKRGVTTYQNDWVLVDYLFYSQNMKLMSRLSLPTAAQCDTYVHFLPNEVNPSDHLPLVADFVIY